MIYSALKIFNYIDVIDYDDLQEAICYRLIGKTKIKIKNNYIS